MHSVYTQILVVILAYLLGTIPFGLLLSLISGLGDPREMGSGNIGATNILRLGNKKIALLTLILDMFKGGMAVWLALRIQPSLAHIAALVAVLGHVFPIWIMFRGGKGVATAFGAIALLSPQLAIIMLVSWLAIAFTSRYSSLAAIITALLTPLFAWLLEHKDLIMMCSGITLIILGTHYQNIKRLFLGREPKIGEKNIINKSNLNSTTEA